MNIKEPEMRYCKHCNRSYKYTFTDRVRDMAFSMKGEFTSEDIAWALKAGIEDVANVLTKINLYVVRKEPGKRGGVMNVYTNKPPKQQLWNVPK